MKCRRGNKAHAFSLVEVVLALGVVAFCIVAILSLLSVGLRNARDSVDEIRAASLASSLVARMQAAPTVDLTAQGFPFGPLTNAGGSLFQISESAPKYLRGDGTVAVGAAEATARRGYALAGAGSYDTNSRVATISFTLWWPPAAAYSNAAGRHTISTFFDTEAP